MSDGWTGINVEAVKGELNAFEEKMTEIHSMYSTAYGLFEDELTRMWASPKAVEFNKILNKLEDYEWYIRRDRDDVLFSASNAAKIMAQHNGATFDYDYKGYYTIEEAKARGENIGILYSEAPSKLKESRNGVQGMNIPMVKYSLDCFRDSASKVVNMLNDIPMEFSLIDPAGELIAMYRSIVSKTADDLRTLISDAAATISEALEEETLQVRLGKEQAEQTLSA